jgi:hypothetical protein
MNGNVELFLSSETNNYHKAIWIKCNDEKDYTIISSFLTEL